MSNNIMRLRNGSTDHSDAQRRHKPDYKIVLFMSLLMLLGLIVMYAIGPQRANVLNNAYGTDYYTSTYFFVKQSISLAFALLAFVFLAFVPYQIIKKHAKRILLIGFGACAVLMVIGNIFNSKIAQCSLGACRWFSLGPFGSIQPSEILKFGLLIYVAAVMASRIKRGLMSDYRTIVPISLLVFLASIAIIFIQKDMGTGIAMISIVASMLVASGVNKKIGLILIGAIVTFGCLMIISAPHRMERISTFFAGDDAATINNSNYHIVHAKIAIGSGGLFGVGIGNSVQATGYLPEAINDSVFAIMGETFGFVGLLSVLALFILLLMRILKIADNLSDPWMKLVVVGAFGWAGSHVILNVAAMIGVFPLTGITLPLLSFGGTSMLFISGALGLVFQLSRYTTHGSRNKEDDSENINSWRGIGRSRYASRGSSRRA